MDIFYAVALGKCLASLLDHLFFRPYNRLIVMSAFSSQGGFIL